MGITAGLCAFIRHYGEKESGIYQTALEHTEKILKKAAATEDFGEMGAGGVCMLLGEVMMSGAEVSFPGEALMGKMAEVVNRSIERDTEKWAGDRTAPFTRGMKRSWKRIWIISLIRENRVECGISHGPGLHWGKSTRKNLQSARTGGRRPRRSRS